ncbi:muscle M-line assembly unc-89-like isoform X5 [Brachionus plicatilis]|uniref:Muscle M-line assembly unc-89-like isoform X5 n=1 Tax=Brachionus plicatilis TaxID=10195 RepID=A0A3M7R0F7_BRAPC|nr:muscle M-line assembly unc-89-like isoform X5 [Brachionus plicatilis]
MVDLSNIEQIDDEVQLNKMLNEATEFEERRSIRKRLLEIKELKSKQRAKEMEDREKRMQKEIEERKQRKEDERRQEVQRFEDLAKTSTADRIENEAGKKRQEFIAEKYQAAEEEKKKNLENFEQMAKGKNNAEYENNSKTNTSKIQNTTMNYAQPKNSSASAFSLFQNKDKEAGGTGKATMAQGASSNPNSPQAIKENLLKWCQQRTEGYPNVNIQNFSSSWADGMAFCALIHSAVPETFDFNKLNPKNRKGNFNLAFKVAEDKCDISPLLDVEDMLMMGNKPDWKCVFTYVQSFYRKLELEPKARAAKNNEN